MNVQTANAVAPDAAAWLPARRLGFYLHTSWEFAYPFAVRSWQREDFQKFFALLESLGFNRVMFWPLSETMPAPLSDADKRELEAMRLYVDDAHAHGLDFWAVFCPNTSVRSEIAAKPFKERHFYPFKIETRLDDPNAKEAYFKHREEILQVFDNADAYVSIDGDPGGYPGAKPEAFLEIFQRDRAFLNAAGRNDAKVVPWLWAGWGSDWEKHGPWREPLEPLTEPVLEVLKANWHVLEPCELLPGRSNREGAANGRKNFEMVEKAGLVAHSTLLTYELIEYEPTPPAVVLQFDDIRRVLKQEAPLIERARGLMGNAQQPIMALPNLFFFARAVHDADYLNRSDTEILHELATFLGGDEAVLVPAWECLSRDLNALPADLPQKLRALKLKASAAQDIPGGSEKYLEILAAFVEARLETLRAANENDGETAIFRGVKALVQWWKINRYVFSGERGIHFRFEFVHPQLRAPVEEVLRAHANFKAVATTRLVREEILSEEEAGVF